MADGELTRLLAELRGEPLDGVSPDAQVRLLSLVYAELRADAARHLRHERPGHTLQPTALVHEVYLRLLSGPRGPVFENRAHFFGIAARCMRQILVDHARARNAAKRGHGEVFQPLTLALELEAPREVGVEAIDEALTRLAAIEPSHARLVELRFFAGLTIEETAEVLGVSTMTVKRTWRLARAWLHRELTP
jgi:RNA polymerase sigma factor (TIGR02999 family)